MSDILFSTAAAKLPAATMAPARRIDQQLVGESLAIREVRQMVRYAARTDIPVLISGPPGTGKEIVAHTLHHLSPRAAQPFVRLNCGTLTAAALAQQLGGQNDVSAIFLDSDGGDSEPPQTALNGSLWLNELADLTPELQILLLRLLDDKRIAGGADTIGGSGARLISATHSDLDLEIAAGSFRSDLYYRLAVFPIDIPPLAQRSEDIIPLVDAAARERGDGSQLLRFTPEALDMLTAYAWPGNARELDNMVERAMLLYPQITISVEQLANLLGKKAGKQGFETATKAGATQGLPAPMPARFDLRAHLLAEERKYLIAALQEANGIVSEAAKHLRLRRTTFVEKMKRHGIERKMIIAQR
jgi:sigma-54 specific flagellar transcriptional regulator A